MGISGFSSDFFADGPADNFIESGYIFLRFFAPMPQFLLKDGKFDN